MKKVFDMWLKKLFDYKYLSECIPNKEMHDYLINNINIYSEETILNIMRCLLHSYNRPIDSNNAIGFKDPKLIEFYKKHNSLTLKTEYFHRLVNGFDAWEGLTWIVQLVRISPIEAIKALSLYLSAECSTMPDYRIMGIYQCMDIIEAKFIKNCSNKEKVLLNLHPREFEILIYKLYVSMKYDAVLTPATRDGGKDVVALRKCNDGTEKLFIECKRYNTTELTNEKVKAFGYNVLDDRSVNRGIMFTTVKVNRHLKDVHPRISILEMDEVIILLNSYLGHNWDERIDLLLKV